MRACVRVRARVCRLLSRILARLADVPCSSHGASSSLSTHGDGCGGDDFLIVVFGLQGLHSLRAGEG